MIQYLLYIGYIIFLSTFLTNFYHIPLILESLLLVKPFIPLLFHQYSGLCFPKWLPFFFVSTVLFNLRP
jgi:hypothetical protein